MPHCLEHALHAKRPKLLFAGEVPIGHTHPGTAADAYGTMVGRRGESHALSMRLCTVVGTTAIRVSG